MPRLNDTVAEESYKHATRKRIPPVHQARDKLSVTSVNEAPVSPPTGMFLEMN